MSASIYFRHGCILYVGLLPDLPEHAHIAPAVCVGPEGPLEIRGRGLADWRTCRAAYIPSNALHEVRTMGRRFATILPEPGNPACETIRPKGTSPKGTRPPDSSQQTEHDSIIPEPEYAARMLEAIRALDEAQNRTQVEAGLDKMLVPAEHATSPETMDARLLKVIRIILAAPDQAPGADELAGAVGMSRSWLLHAFKSQVGVPIRRFRAWFRLKAAALLMHRGDSPAQAALGAGFYDQSHYANVFREMLGIQPGLVFGTSIRWYIEDEPLVDHLLEGIGAAS